MWPFHSTGVAVEAQRGEGLLASVHAASKRWSWDLSLGSLAPGLLGSGKSRGPEELVAGSCGVGDRGWPMTLCRGRA